MQSIIKVNQLTKQYNKAKEPAVDGISFEVQKGDFFAFLGPNGAGKTTTISILTTTLQATSGEVTIAGYDLVRETKQIREKVGIIFQKPSLDTTLTAEDNIRFHACLYGMFSYRPTFSLMPAAQNLADHNLVYFNFQQSLSDLLHAAFANDCFNFCHQSHLLF
jgi:ABC-2 type transport system ATP-binding protein